VLIVNVPQKYTGYTVYKHLMMLLGRWEWGYETEYSSGMLERSGSALGLEVLEKKGYGYWRSPFEPFFMMRTVVQKAGKIRFIKESPVHGAIERFWDRKWKALESRYGHFFMRNIIYVYRKSG